MQVVAPGDLILELPESGKLRVGSGVLVDGKELIAVRNGSTQQTNSGKVWLAGRQKR